MTQYNSNSKFIESIRYYIICIIFIIITYFFLVELFELMKSSISRAIMETISNVFYLVIDFLPRLVAFLR